MRGEDPTGAYWFDDLERRALGPIAETLDIIAGQS